MIFEEVKKIHITRYPYKDFLYKDNPPNPPEGTRGKIPPVAGFSEGASLQEDCGGAEIQ